jgi:hypothetical protein
MWGQIFLGLGTHKLNFQHWHLQVNKFSVHTPLGENKKHKTNAQNKKMLGMYITTTLSRTNAQNKILFSTYTTTVSQANTQRIKSCVILNFPYVLDDLMAFESWESLGFR